MSAIHKRLHYSQKLEFGLLAKVFGESLPPVYNFQVGSGQNQIKQQDFDDRVDIVPVSDPNIFSQSQRVTLAQELLQMVQPDMLNSHLVMALIIVQLIYLLLKKER